MANLKVSAIGFLFLGISIILIIIAFENDLDYSTMMAYGTAGGVFLVIALVMMMVGANLNSERSKTII